MGSRAPISVVIPCFNVEAYIGETLQSLVAQDLQPAEVIVIDDGSTDNTVCEVERFHNLLDIKLLRIENSGQGFARNLGILQATSPYIYFLDADDKVTTGMLAKLSGALKEYGWPDLLFFAGRAFYDFDYCGDFSRSYARKREFPPVSPDRAIVMIGRDRLFSASPCLYVSRRCLWGSEGLSFKNIIHEDEELLYRLVLVSDSVSVIGDELFLRRLRNRSSMTEPKTVRHVIGRYEVLKSSLVDLKRYRMFSLPVGWALRKRVFWMTLSYFKVCAQAGEAFRLRSIFTHGLKNKSPELMLAILVGLILAKFKLLS